MEHELELTKANRLKLAWAFQKNKRVDYSIDCVVEGHMGKAFVDNLAYPMTYCITVGPFYYFAGVAQSASGYLMMEGVLKISPFSGSTDPSYRGLATWMAKQPESSLDLSDFDSLQDFCDRGLGFAILDQSTVVGVAYSSLVCSQGIEVSIFVEEPYRRQGVATALGSRPLLECLQRDLRPYWDAANPESSELALKLGYVFVEAYDAYYFTEN